MPSKKKKEFHIPSAYLKIRIQKTKILLNIKNKIKRQHSLMTINILEHFQLIYILNLKNSPLLAKYIIINLKQVRVITLVIAPKPVLEAT